MYFDANASKYIGVCDACRLRRPMFNMAKNLGLCPNLQGGESPLTPSIELPNPSILEGLPRQLAGQNVNVLTNQEGRIVSVSTPYPPSPLRVQSGTVDTRHVESEK